MAKTPQILIPAPGCSVPQEDGQPWPAEGLPDPDTSYTRRRVRVGDLIPAPATKPAKSEGDAK